MEKQREEKKLPIYKYKPEFTIKKVNDLFVVESEKMEKMVDQYDLDNPQALQYLQKILKSIGIEKALKRKGITDGDQVKIGDKDFYFYS
jgi:GTP-binding protein